MCWKEQGGQAILTFRALLQSELFDTTWEMLNKKYISDVKLPENGIPFHGKHQKTVSGWSTPCSPVPFLYAAPAPHQ